MSKTSEYLTEVRTKLTNKRFWSLTVLQWVGGRGLSSWECLCDCGKTSFFSARSLEGGTVRHCGCEKTLVCSVCKESKDFSSFSKQKMRKQNNRGYSLPCKACVAAKYSERAKSPEFKKSKTDAPRKYKYGITNEDFVGKFNAQGRCCAICKRDTLPEHLKQIHRIWHADHDHDSGGFRGVLCRKCNMGLGCFADSADVLKQAVDYLSRTKGTPRSPQEATN